MSKKIFQKSLKTKKKQTIYNYALACFTKFEHKNANYKLCMKYKNVNQISICFMGQIKGLHKSELI